MSFEFFQTQEKDAIEQFLAQGFLVFPLEDTSSLDCIRATLLSRIGWQSTGDDDREAQEYLDYFHQINRQIDLNALRLDLIEHLGADPQVRPAIFNAARRHLGWLVGNELAMQRKCNLSIQRPQDESALLPLHADVWSGNSPYEVVLWLPLVNCFKTKSMFLLPRMQSQQVYDEFSQYSELTTEELYREIERDLVWLDVEYGQGVIFWHGLLHGNRVNRETQTRWTVNVRFKSLLSPYGTKEIGESFLPITVRPMTRIGYQYRAPTV